MANLHVKTIACENIEHKIPIQHKSIQHVRVVPFELEGDNKSIHEAPGFVESFLANYPCANCDMHQDELLAMFRIYLT